MTTEPIPPLHCSKPMRRSETQKGHPWWCSECGEYLERGKEGVANDLDALASELGTRMIQATEAKFVPLGEHRISETLTGETLGAFIRSLSERYPGGETAFYAHEEAPAPALDLDGLTINGAKIQLTKITNNNQPVHRNGMLVGFVKGYPRAYGYFKTEDGKEFDGARYEDGWLLVEADP